MVSDSDLRKWIYKEHTKVKHELLEKYLGGWIPILGSRNDRLLILDGFAGRGTYEDGTAGSPQVILRKASEIIAKGQVSKLYCAFVEKDIENFNNLTNILHAIKPQVSNIGILGPFNSDFASVAEQALSSVNGRLIPSFFFIDPFGFTGVPFDLVKRILSLDRSEVFITFMLRDVARFLSHSNLDETFDSLFGTSRWREIVSSNAVNQEKERLLRDLYIEQLASSGRYVTTFRVCMDEKVQTLYYMIHASNHPKGRILMKEVMARQGSGGLFAYLGPSDKTARAQLALFADDINELKSLLLKKFAGRRVTYDAVQTESCMETDLIDRDYRKALQELRKEGKISVKPVTSKTERGLSGFDLIAFPGK